MRIAASSSRPPSAICKKIKEKRASPLDDILKHQLRGDRVIWALYGLLVAISLVEGFSSQSFFVARASSTVEPLLQHAIHLALGFVAMVAVLSVNYRHIRMVGWAVWIGSVILLLYTLVGASGINGAARWVFGLQPSEFAKLGLIVATADWVARAKNPNKPDFEEKYFKWFVCAVLVTCGLIFPGNLSTAALLFTVIVAMLFCGGIAAKRVLGMCGCVVAAVALVLLMAWIVPQEHFIDEQTGSVRTGMNAVESGYYRLFGRAYTWKGRIERFSDEKKSEYVINDATRQPVYGQIAIARGGFFPHLPGSSEVRNKLPQAYSDFVFSIIVEELGSILGGLSVIAIYLVLLFRAGRVAYKATTVYPAVLVIGVALMVVLQALVHMAVCVQLIPVTGQPLPLITRGGSSILVTSIYFGLLLNVTCYASANQEAQSDLLPADEMEGAATRTD